VHRVNAAARNALRKIFSIRQAMRWWAGRGRAAVPKGNAKLLANKADTFLSQRATGMPNRGRAIIFFAGPWIAKGVWYDFWS